MVFDNYDYINVLSIRTLLALFLPRKQSRSWKMTILLNERPGNFIRQILQWKKLMMLSCSRHTYNKMIPNFFDACPERSKHLLSIFNDYQIRSKNKHFFNNFDWFTFIIFMLYSMPISIYWINISIDVLSLWISFT